METVDVCVELENDEFYSKFLYEDAKRVLEDGGSVGEQVEKLSVGIAKLNSHLERQVLLKHTDLLTQASHVTDLESELGEVQTHVLELLRGAHNLRSHVHTQHDALSKQTGTLDRALTTCHLLRHAARILALYGKLPALLHDPPKRAVVLFQIDELLADYDFEGIHLLEDVIVSVKQEKEELLSTATRELQDGLVCGDKLRSMAAFKVLHNMRQTQGQIDETISCILDSLRTKVKEALDIQAPPSEHKKSSRSGPGRANIMSTNELKNRLWDNLERLFKNEVGPARVKVLMLQNILDELRTIGNFRNIARNFWDDFCTMFADYLDKSSITVNQCIEIDFPKLLKCFNDLSSNNGKHLEPKRELLMKWENSFLSKSLGKLLEPVRSMWQLNRIPTTDQVDMAVRFISDALNVSLGDEQLSLALAASVAKCIKQMIVEAEQRLCVDGDIAQIIEAPTSSQQKNAEICNVMYYFSSRVNRTLANMKPTLHFESVTLVRNSLEGVSSLPVLRPLAASVIDSLQVILLTMHDERDLMKEDDPAGKSLSCNPYMKELQHFLSRCRDMYFSVFSDRAAVDVVCSDVSSRCIERFIQNACVVRPLSAFGRAKLRQDCRQLESTLGELVSDWGMAGDSLRRLRALHALLDISPTDIVQSQRAGAAVPYSYVCMYMFSFGDADLLSPHSCAGWNVSALLGWLDTHPAEADRLDLVAGALRRYQAHVRQNNITNYHHVYPVLLQLLDDGRKVLQI